MKLQMLISGLNIEPVRLLEGMHLECNGILVNQCDKNAEEEAEIAGYHFKIVSSTDRGVGASRNLAFSYAQAEYLLFSDEDIVYESGYAQKILDEFESLADADMILFNVKVCEERRTYWNEGRRRVRRHNCGRFPAYSIAVKKEALDKTGIRYSLLFGGGARYSNGEDSLFLQDCAKAGMKMYTSPVCIGEEIPRDSTWFHGFTEKFFFDRGVLFAFLYGNLALIWALRFVLVKKEMFTGEIDRRKAWKLICDGIKRGKEEKKGSA